MTFVGKILVVVQLVLSCCFVAFAGAVFTYQKNWRNEYQDLEKRLQRVDAELGEKSSILANYEKEARAALTNNQLALDPNDDPVQKAIAGLDVEAAEADRLKAELDLRTNELQDEIDSNKRAEELLTVAKLGEDFANDEADARLDEAEVVRELNDRLIKENRDKEQQLEAVEDSLFASRRDLTELTERYETQLLEIARLTRLLLENDVPLDSKPKGDADPAPDVEGLVLKTKRDRQTELVEISIGSDDGLNQGDSLFVFRTSNGGKYLGRIHVVYVQSDRAVGTVVERAKNGRIERGDSVATKL